MRIFFTSDYHLNHANIIRYCGRPFVNVEEMNNTIIKNHNSRVKEGDLVFHIGDFCFKNSAGGKEGEGLPEKSSDLLNKLNGDIVCIKGNHDRNNSLKTPIEKAYIKYGGKRICLTHNPTHADPECEINFVGHVHEKWQIRPLGEKSIMINVGVDVWNFKPVTYEEINSRYWQWKRENATTKTEESVTE